MSSFEFSPQIDQQYIDGAVGSPSWVNSTTASIPVSKTGDLGSNPNSPAIPLIIIIDRIRTGSPEHFGLLSDWQWKGIREKLLRAGITPTQVKIVSLNDFSPCGSNAIIVGFGEAVLEKLTGKHGIDKWQLSPLRFDGGILIPTFDLDRSRVEYDLGLFQEMAFQRMGEFSRKFPAPPVENFRLNPELEETFHLLDYIKDQPEVAVDVETGYGQINTVGFAWSESDALAINVLPDRCSDESYFKLWKKIAGVLEGPSRKILQNFVYDVSYFSAYGIRTENVTFDTMWAMKILYPELKANLGNVGRVYTRRPYWKDDGKVTDEEGGKKDWGNVRDWVKHYMYNCRDTSGTLEASRSQRKDLTVRGLDKFYETYIARLISPTLEMCSRGMPFSIERRDNLAKEIEAKVAEATKAFHETVGSEINPNSTKQVQSYLKSVGVTIPKKFDKKKGESRDTLDTGAVKKLRLKYPERRELAFLQDVKIYRKTLSSYINFDAAPNDPTIRYSLNMCGTETLRASGHCDPWGRGFNIQTIPREGGKVSVKSMMIAPEGKSFVEIDLKAAETYYVAYASACSKLISMLESKQDIHKYVAHAILRGLGKPPEDYSKKWRDLGKKTGHGSNYLMKEGTFVENVFKDMDMILSKKDAKIILESYFQEFPEIRQWHQSIRRELYNKGKLSSPSGWERYFYGRPGDDMLREAVAWTPQHTIPWITNRLMLYLCDERRNGNLDFHLHAQVHDALYLTAQDDRVCEIVESANKLNVWHPKIILPGGQMTIPIEIKTGKCLANMEEIK